MRAQNDSPLSAMTESQQELSPFLPGVFLNIWGELGGLVGDGVT